ncbi:MAG: T9SS type A sorting domain-containing protein [Bacteroidetes bacterium]|nr:MAG: T9SS type A sorting domain-containing protein [Bacteroidota bacterium]
MKVSWKHNIWIVGLLLTTQLWAQPYFQKIYKLGDTTSLFGDVYVTDSAYYLEATVGYGNNYLYTQLVKVDEFGELIGSWKNDQGGHQQSAAFSRTDMDTNFRGNLVMGYKSSSNDTSSQLRVTEYDFDGNIVSNFWLTDFVKDSILFYANGTLLTSNRDSSYYLTFTYSDLRTDLPDIGFQGETGTMLIKVKYTGATLWFKKFRYTPMGTSKPSWPRGYHVWVNDSTQLMSVFENLQSGNGQAWGRVHFFTLDKDGNITEEYIFQDTQDDERGLTFLRLKDGGVIYPYFESKLDDPPNEDEFRHRSVMARLNSKFELLWKDSLNDFFGYKSDPSIPSRIRYSSDSTFLYAFDYYQRDSIYSKVRIENRSLDGKILWRRDYFYFPVEPYLGVTYHIMDLEQTSARDWLLVGQVVNYDLIDEGLSGQNAYLLKTNCLGFMGDPKAAVDIYDLGNNQVKLVNKSVQAGNFEWDLGDGTLLNTRESVDKEQDTILHSYSDHEAYVVKLIAKGCPGKADTIEVPWNWVKLNELEKNNEHLLQIAPNPVSANDLLSVYVGNIDEGYIEVIDVSGRSVNKVPVAKGNAYYGICPSWESGTYFARLVKEQEILSIKKLIVR